MKRFLLLLSLVLTPCFAFAQIQWTEITPPTQFQILSLVSHEGYIYAATMSFVGSTAGNGVFRSSDFGVTWEQAGSLLKKKDVYAMTLTPLNELYASSYSKLYKYSFTNSEWTEISLGNIKISRIHYITGDGNGRLAVVDGDVGCIVLDPGTGSWRVYLPGKSAEQAWFTPDGGLLVSVYPNEMYKISGDSVTKVAYDTGLSYFYTTENETIIASAGGLHISSDNGTSWKRVLTSKEEMSTAIISNEGLLYAIYLTKLYISKDQGITWTAGALGLPKFQLTALAIDGEKNIFAANTAGKLFRGRFTTNSTEEGIIPATIPYPNPADEFIMIPSAGYAGADVSIELFSLTGARIAGFSAGGGEPALIPTTQLQPGFYYALIRSGDRLVSHKFQVLH